VADHDAAADAVRGVDAVSHQAAMVGLGTSPADIVAYVANNDLATATLLQALHSTGFRGRIVLASSMVVYGEGAYTCTTHGRVRPIPRSPAALEAGWFDPQCPRCRAPLAPVEVTEEDAPDPRNVYAATKLHQEHLCFSFGRETGVDVVALRYHNVYGPRMPRDTPYAGVASIFRSALEAGDAPQVYEDGRQTRDFVHVADVARANVLAMMSPRVPSGAFNIANGEPHSVLDMAEELSAAFGPGAPRPQVNNEFRVGDVRHVFASPARAATNLGFRARISFSRGIRSFATDPLRASASLLEAEPTPS
jgi:dTDP-L-rhamnose 4-epimerase